MDNNYISVKAVVDKANNRVVFVESDESFVDILFSFLTMPIGTAVRLTRNRPPATNIGCMNNLYNSVEILDRSYFRTEACKTMLLYPRNGAGAKCKNLKLEINDGARLEYFLCDRDGCSLSDYKLLSHYSSAICGCGEFMDNEKVLTEKESSKVVLDDRDRGVFVKGPVLLTISDDLQVMPSSTPASLALFSKLGIKDTNTIEESTFLMGVLEAFKLLKCLLVSKTPLTEALLDHNPAIELNNTEDFEQVIFRRLKMEDTTASDEEGKIYVKLMVSKSKNMVCYAEASEKFVDLLFSFLTIPVGFIAREMKNGSSKACINHLYDSIQDLDDTQYLISKETTAMLVCPKLAPGFRFDTQPLDIGEYMDQPYYLYLSTRPYRGIPTLTSDETLIPPGEEISTPVLTVMDPKSRYNDNLSGSGFLKGPAMFTITDDLIITPLSSVTGLSTVRKLKVPFSDIEERIVYVGKEEASRLLVTSFVSESALTNTFLLQEYSS